MKKRSVCILLCTALMFSCANAQTLLLQDNQGKLRLVCDESGTNFVTISVLSENADATAIVPSENMKNILVKTLEPNSTGKFVFDADLSQSFERGRYIVRTYANDLICENIYAVGNIGDEELAKINSAQTLAQLKATIAEISGFDNLSADYIDGVAGYIAAIKPQNGYNSYDFISAYMIGEAVARLNRSDITLDDMLTYYSAYTGVDYATYAQLNDRQKAGARDIAKNISYNKPFSDYYDEIITLARIKGAQSFEDLQTKYLAYAAANGISLVDYNSLAEYDRDMVFVSMYASIDSVHSKSEIDALFAACVGAAKAGVSNGGTSSGGGGGGGGGVSGGGTTYLPPSYEDNTELPFNDMASHWSVDYVSVLKAHGVANGYEDGTYRPDNTVTRAEFVKMVAQICGTEKSNDKIFDDVTADDWYFSIVNGAYKNGIVSGVTETLFEPESRISRQDAAVIINRVKGYSSVRDGNFADSEQISPYAQNAVAALANANIIKGYEDNCFRPNAFVTRAECAAMLAKAFYPSALSE